MIRIGKAPSSPEMISGGFDNWGTPQWLFDYWDRKYHFTLDPCAEEHNAKCERYFTMVENGLMQSWENENVWMNPPFGRDMWHWIEKAYLESKHSLIVGLFPARTCTQWFHKYVLGKTKLYFIRGRIAFLHPHTGKEARENPASMVIAIWSPYITVGMHSISTVEMKK